MPNFVHPFDFGEAKAAAHQASQNMIQAERDRSRAVSEAAATESAYRKALARRIVELRAEGQPVTIVPDLARGDEQIADLRYCRDVAKGVLAIQEQASWRLTADRKDVTALIDWSARVAPDGQREAVQSEFTDVSARRAA